MAFKKIIFIVGPTGVGKSAVAFELVKRLKGEIISCDAMQVYREVSIINNKPSPEIQRAIPHYLIGTISAQKDFNVADFRKKALKAVAVIHKKNKIPIFVGGSGLYMSVLLDGIFEDAGANEALRAKLEALASRKGTEFLYARLKKIDPASAKKIHPNDLRRMIRALEVFETSKAPISQLQTKREGLWGKYDIHIFALNREREKLYSLIDRRVEQMMEDGAVEEVKGLLSAKKKISKTARAMIGVKEIEGFLNGDHDMARAKYLMKRNTRHYAKRQLTWFRREKRLSWVMMDTSATPLGVAQKILNKVSP